MGGRTRAACSVGWLRYAPCAVLWLLMLDAPRCGVVWTELACPCLGRDALSYDSERVWCRRSSTGGTMRLSVCYAFDMSPPLSI